MRDRLQPRHTVLALLMTAFFSTMVARLIVSPLVPRFLSAFSVSKGAIGLALTGMWGAYAVTQLPAGVLADRYGERRVVLLAIAVTGAGGTLLAVASTYPVFAAAAVLVGLGSGFYFPPAASLLTGLFENTGQVLGLHISGGDLAGLVTPVAVTVVAARFGWRTALFLAPAVAALVLVLCVWLLRPAPDPAGPSRGGADPRALVALLSRPELLYTVALATLLAFVFQAVISFFPTFLIEHRSLEAGTANGLFSLVFLLWIAFMPVAGRLSDRVGHDGVLAATSTSMTAGVALLVATPGFLPGLLGVVLLGVGMSWGGVVASRFMADIPEADRTAGYGLVRSLYVLLGSSGSVVTGTLAGTMGWRAAYGLLVVLLAAVVASIAGNRVLDLGL